MGALKLLHDFFYKQRFYKQRQRLAFGNQRFPVRVRLLAMCRGELSVVIARLMSKVSEVGGSS